MKELSIEQKAKAYDESIERAKQLSKELTVDDIIEQIFPELAESEDERIRKELISHFKETIDNIKSEEIIPRNAKILVGKMQKWIIWLEKQGEQKPWSEDDEERYESCLQKLSTGNPEQPETINSKWFKEHVYSKPKSTWRPSDRQMSVLEYYMHTLACNEHKEILFGLYTDLKKLRER